LFDTVPWGVLSLNTLNLKRPEPSWNTDTIPKVIHQMAPKDRQKWHVSWEPCHETFKVHFSDFEHKMWTDEALDAFVASRHAALYETYQNLAFPIQRFDLARYLILYEFGGIYADMDVECLDNFYGFLQPGKANIAMSEHANEDFQNALMASPPKHPFWHYVISEVIGWQHSKDVIASTGPIMLSRVARVAPSSMIHPLKNSLIKVDTSNAAHDMKKFTPSPKHPNIMAVHHGTGTWIDRQKNQDTM
jgi:mannosyltransferase OCH1-like enzyme